MAAMTEKNVLEVEGKFKLIRKIEIKKTKTNLCWDFGLVNSTI
jgi:hypothetical protein